MGLVASRAILLRAHPYGETSRILRFFTEELGVVGVMARGARRASSKGSGDLSTFAGGDLTVFVKQSRDLQTMKDFTITHPRRGLGRSVLRLGAASALGELVLRHGGEAANPILCQALEQSLDRVDDASEKDVVTVLLRGGWGLVSLMGYRPVLDACVECGRELGEEMGRMDFGAGGVRCTSCGQGGPGPRVGSGARAQIAALVEGERTPLTRPRAHLRIFSDFVTYHLEGRKPLESFRFLAGFLPVEDDDVEVIPGNGEER